MNTKDFSSRVTSTKLRENMAKQFGVHVNLGKYNREQLEDMRNKLRTRVFQHEGSSRFNDLLSNENYQKDKAMLELLNTRIKEMLGEDIKKLKDKLIELSEGKKGVKIAKHPQGSKSAAKDYDGDGKKESPKDEVWGSRAKAAAKAGKPFSEGQGEADDTDRKPTKKTGERDVTLPSGAKVKARTYQGHQSQKADKEAKFKKNDLDEAAKECNHSDKGERCPVHGLKECGMYESKPSAGMSKKEKSAVVKKAKAGGDIGKKGKGFEKIEKAAGGGEKGKKIAAAAMWKQQAKENFKRNVRVVNESLAYLLAEDEEGKAKAITAAGDMVNDYTSWMQRVGQYQTKSMIELADAIRADFGAQEAETFKQSVGPALQATLEVLTQQREAISQAVAVLAGEATPEVPMGAEPGMAPAEPGMPAAGPDMMNPAPAGDEFAAADAAAGGAEAAGRAVRESKEQRRARRLAEQHNILAKLAR